MAMGGELIASNTISPRSRLLWLFFGFLSAGYVSLFSHSANIFIPTLVVIWLVLHPEPLFKGLSRIWFTVTLGLIFLVLLSALIGVHAGVRSVGFAAFSTLPFVGLSLVPEQKSEKAVLDYFVAAAFGIIIWNMIFFGFLGGNLGPWQSWNPAGTGNSYGVYLNMIWPVLFFAARQETDRQKATAFYLLALLCLILALATFSRAAIGSAAISVLLIFGQTKGRLASITAIILAAVLFFVFRDQVVRVLEYVRLVNFTPDLGRFNIWSLAWQRILNNPLFGVAPGGVPLELAEIGVYHAHNTVLNTALESGLLAGALIALIFFALIVCAARLLFCCGMSVGYGCAILAYLSSSVVSTTTNSPELTFALVLVVAVSRLNSQSHRSRVR
jgi:O-antigen ligase